MKRAMVAAIAVMCLGAKWPAAPESASCRDYWGRVDVRWQSEASMIEEERAAAKVAVREPIPVSAPAGRLIIDVARYDDPVRATGAGWEALFGDLAQPAAMIRQAFGVREPRPSDFGLWAATFAIEPPAAPPFDVHLVDGLTNSRCDIHVLASGDARRFKKRELPR